ncbi:MAG: Hsp20/alpha crystallin family protein [Lautropia sp.]
MEDRNIGSMNATDGDAPVSRTNPGRRDGGADGGPDERPALRPPVDVIEDATGITLYADMPGVAKDQLKLDLDGDQLRIEGEVALDLPSRMSASHAEVQVARYRRTFALSKELDAENIRAECRHGVLKLRIPKAKHAQPRRIEITVN